MLRPQRPCGQQLHLWHLHLSNQNAYVEYDPDQSLNDAITAYEKKYLENVCGTPAI